MDIGIYCPSYNRWDAIKTGNIIPEITYVVRKSQEKKYKEAGIENIWAVEDKKINSWVKVMNYIIENSKQDHMIVMDDDIETFHIVTDEDYEIYDKEEILSQLERMSNVMSDLKIGFGALYFVPDPKQYKQEIVFAGTLGSVYFFNRKELKSKFIDEAYAVADAEFELQELLKNRIVYLPRWFKTRSFYNQGRDTQKRTASKVTQSMIWTKLKWGKYFQYNEDKNSTKIKIDR